MTDEGPKWDGLSKKHNGEHFVTLSFVTMIKDGGRPTQIGGNPCHIRCGDKEKQHHLKGSREWQVLHLDHSCELICEFVSGLVCGAIGQVLLPLVGGAICW